MKLLAALTLACLLPAAISVHAGELEFPFDKPAIRLPVNAARAAAADIPRSPASHVHPPITQARDSVGRPIDDVTWQSPACWYWHYGGDW